MMVRSSGPGGGDAPLSMEEHKRLLASARAKIKARGIKTDSQDSLRRTPSHEPPRTATSSPTFSENVHTVAAHAASPQPSPVGVVAEQHTAAATTPAAAAAVPVHDHSAVEVEGLKAEMAAIQTQLDQAQREREEARAAVDHLVAERDALQARSDVLARAQQSLETEADSLTSEREELLSRLAETEAELVNAHSRLTRQEVESNEQKARMLDELKAAVESCTEAQELVEALSRENQELKSRIGSQNGQWTAQLSELRQEAEALRAQLADVEVQLAAARAGEAAHAEESAGRLGQITALEEEKTKLLADIEQLRSAAATAAAAPPPEPQPTPDMPSADEVEKIVSVVQEQAQRIAELESEISDKDNLVATVHSNAQALSRAMLQNKELRTQLQEIQDRFVDVTQKQMDIVTELQSAQHEARHWKARALAAEQGESNVVDEERMARHERAEAALAQQIMLLQKQNASLLERLAQRDATPAPAPAPGPVPAAASAPAPAAAAATGEDEVHVHAEGAEDHAHQAEQPDERAKQLAEEREMQLLESLSQLESEKEKLEGEREKLAAELEHEKSLVNQLASEAETIPTYIQMYHAERKKWQDKEAEKDAEIARLHQVIAAYSERTATPVPAAV